MKYIEDEFDLDEFRESFRLMRIVPVKNMNIFVKFFLTLAELAVAFTVAYYLYKGGQFLIDLFLN